MFHIYIHMQEVLHNLPCTIAQYPTTQNNSYSKSTSQWKYHINITNIFHISHVQIMLQRNSIDTYFKNPSISHFSCSYHYVEEIKLGIIGAYFKNPPISHFSCSAHDVEELKLGIIVADFKHPPISHFLCSAHAVEELKLGIIGAYFKHPPMPTPIPIFMAPSAPPTAQPSNIQHVKFQTISYQGRGMSLKLHGASDTTIMKMGCCYILKFPLYIHNKQCLYFKRTCTENEKTYLTPKHFRHQNIRQYSFSFYITSSTIPSSSSDHFRRPLTAP